MDKKTNILQLFEAIGNKDTHAAKRLIEGVNEELEYLESLHLNATAVSYISDIKKLVENIEKGSIDIAWGKANLTFQAAYSGHLKNPLKDRRPQDRTVKLSSRPDQINGRYRAQRSDELVQHFNGSGKLNSSSTQKKTDNQNVKREHYNDNIAVTNFQQQQTYAERGEQNHETSKLDKSKIASELLRNKNPDITDLSDTNRPTKLAERFSELYDNEWTEAYEAMAKFKKAQGVDERQIIKALLEIVEKAYTFCSRATNSLKQTTLGKVDLLDERNKIIKQLAENEILRLQQKFYLEEMPKITLPSFREADAYARKAVELAWWMNIHDPPVHMVLSQQSNHTFDPNLYRAYTKSGHEAVFFVWPPLTLYNGGGVLCKGVVQCK